MFSDKELEATIDVAERKIGDILNDDSKPLTIGDLRDLQTLVVLKDSAKRKLNKED